MQQTTRDPEKYLNNVLQILLRIIPHRINDHACGVERAQLSIAKITVGEHTVRDVKVIRLDC